MTNINNTSYKVEGTTLYVYGEKNEFTNEYTIPYFSSLSYESRDMIKTIIMEDIIERIPDHRFDDFHYVEKIILPKNLKKIGQGAFRGLKNLKCITLPKTLKYIDYSAFEGCKQLCVDVPYEIECIQENAFKGCKQINYIKNIEEEKKVNHYLQKLEIKDEKEYKNAENFIRKIIRLKIDDSIFNSITHMEKKNYAIGVYVYCSEPFTYYDEDRECYEETWFCQYMFVIGDKDCIDYYGEHSYDGSYTFGSKFHTTNLLDVFNKYSIREWRTDWSDWTFKFIPNENIDKVKIKQKINIISKTLLEKPFDEDYIHYIDELNELKEEYKKLN